MDIETRVKMHVYETLARTGDAPDAGRVAMDLGLGDGEVRGAFAALHQKRLLVPEPGDPSRIRMAPPFSGVPTQHVVRAGGRRYFANCAWDTFGIAAALHQDADIESACGDCGDALSLAIQGQRPRPDPVLFHCAVPAARWWRDIIFTRSTMLFFRSEEHVRRWCEAKGTPVRPLVDLEQLWFLSTTWYGNRLTAESRRPGVDEMTGIFASIGLHGDFWDPASDVL